MEFTIKTNKREEVIDITQKVKEIVDKQANKDDKACLVYARHTTCSLILNENEDSAVGEDINNFLRNLIKKGIWEHDRLDGNCDSHIKSALLGQSQTIPLENKKLMLGRYQQIALCEFDGPRERKIIVQIL
jgi:secondary thiamine-phosphate synthase enzyme